MGEKLTPQLERTEMEPADQEGSIVSPDLIETVVSRVEERSLLDIQGDVIWSAIPNPQKKERIEQLDELSLSLVGRKISDNYFLPNEIPYFEKNENYYHASLLPGIYQEYKIDFYEFLPDGSVLSGGHEGGIAIHRPPKGEENKYTTEILKSNDFRSPIRSLQALPDGRILVLHSDRETGKIFVLSRNQKGEYSQKDEFLVLPETEIYCFQAISQNVIAVSLNETLGNGESSLVFFRKNKNGKWQKEEIFRGDDKIISFQAFEDEVIFSGSENGHVRVHAQDSNNEWHGHSIFQCSSAIRRIQVLPKGDVLLADDKGEITLYPEGNPAKSEIIRLGATGQLENISVNGLRAYPDGRILFGEKVGNQIDGVYCLDQFKGENV